MSSIRRVRSARAVLAAMMLALIAVLAPFAPAFATPASANSGANASVRVVHAIPTAPAVDVYARPAGGGAFAKLVSGATFFSATGYLAVPAGSYDVQVVPAGAAPGAGALIEAQLKLQGGKRYSVVARLEDGKPSASVLDDNYRRPNAGTARIRAAHFSPDAPAVDIYLNGKKAITNLAYGKTTPYITVKPGSYTVGIAPKGGSPIYTTEVTIGAAQVATAWANGLLNGSGAQAFKVTPTIDEQFPDTVYLRAIHAVPDIAGSPVDVYVNGVKATTFDFFSVSPYLALPIARDYEVRVVPAGGDPKKDAVIVRKGLRLGGGKYYSVVARGTAAPGVPNLISSFTEDDNSTPPEGKVRLRVAHFAPDAPGVDIYANGTKVLSNLKYREFSHYLTIDPGTYEIGVAPAGGSPIYTTSVTLEAGQVATAWANGLLSGSGAQAFKVTPSIDRAADE